MVSLLPEPGRSAKVTVQKDLPATLEGAEAVILAVPHAPYLDLDPDQVVQWAGGPLAVIDCFGILDDTRIGRYFELGCEVKALGRGHIQRIKKEVNETPAGYEPLFAVYRKRVKPLLDRALEHGGRRIVTIFDACRTRTVQLGEGEGPDNVNTAADYESLLLTTE